MKNVICSIFTAIRFLTIIPLSPFAEKDSEYFINSVRFFMLVGLLVGCIQVLLIKILQPFLPHQLLCCVLILSLAAISGFLHLDGLADTADGFFSSRPREQILQIMKDSRNGAMGIIGILFILLFKYAALSAIPPGSMVHRPAHAIGRKGRNYPHHVFTAIRT